MKLPEPFVYFVDRSLGRGIVVEALSTGGSLRVLLAAGDWLEPPKEIK